MGSSKKQTTGYRYSFAIHMGVARGPLNNLKEVRVGDLTAWTGVQDDNGDIAIDKPDLFGGDTKEGGIVGTLSVFMGAAAQTFSSTYKALMGGFVPDFRGITSLFYRGQISSNNPYPKPWSFRVARWSNGWDLDDTDPYRAAPWYEVKARVLLDGPIEAMNPAHILYQAYTDRSWGKGYHPSWLHEESWTAAANTLCDEGFGLCLLWNRQTDINEFILTVRRHIGALIYPDAETDQLVIRLVRGDYVADDLPVFGYDSGIVSISDDETGSDDNSFSEIIVKYTDPITGEEASVTEHSLALMQANGGEISSTTASYPGLPTASLAHRVGRRDLDSQMASKRLKIEFDRAAWALHPGAVFKVNVPSLNLNNIIMRAGTVEDTEFINGRILVTAVQDFFGLADSGYSETPERGWTPPDNLPVAPDPVVVMEANWRDLAATLSNSDLATVPADSGAVATLAAQPSGTSVYYDLATGATGEEVQVRAQGDWTPYAVLAADVGVYDTVLTFVAGSDLVEAQVGEALMIGDEIMAIDAVDTVTLEITVRRGCADTIPQAHAEDDVAWFYEDFVGTDGRDYADGEVLDVRFMTVTSSSRMEVGDAASNAYTIVARAFRPYPPGDVKVEGDPFGSLGPVYVGELAFTWTHRDRLLQDDTLVEHEAASVGPEAGTTYNIRLYDGVTLLRSTTGITADTWTYDSTMITADGAPASGSLRVELESERDSATSLFMYDFVVPRVSPVILTAVTGEIEVVGSEVTSVPTPVRLTAVTGDIEIVG